MKKKPINSSMKINRYKRYSPEEICNLNVYFNEYSEMLKTLERELLDFLKTEEHTYLMSKREIKLNAYFHYSHYFENNLLSFSEEGDSENDDKFYTELKNFVMLKQNSKWYYPYGIVKADIPFLAASISDEVDRCYYREADNFREARQSLYTVCIEFRMAPLF